MGRYNYLKAVQSIVAHMRILTEQPQRYKTPLSSMTTRLTRASFPVRLHGSLVAPQPIPETLKCCFLVFGVHVWAKDFAETIQESLVFGIASKT